MTTTTGGVPPAGSTDAVPGLPASQEREPARTRTSGLRALAGRLGVRLLALGVFLGAWALVTRTGVVDPLYLPSPAAVWRAFVRANSDHPIAPGVARIVRGEQDYYLWEHLVASLQRIGVGVGAAVVLGPPLGFLMASSRTVGTVLEPYLNFLRALPPLGYIGLLIVWFGIGDTSKIWLLFLAAFPPITLATISGVRGVRADWLHAVRTLGASRLQAVTHVVLPATLPEILNGIRIAVGFAWTTVVAAELNNGIPGIGGLAYVSGTQLNTPLTLACIAVIGLAAVLLDLAIKAVASVLVPWRGHG